MIIKNYSNTKLFFPITDEEEQSNQKGKAFFSPSYH